LCLRQAEFFDGHGINDQFAGVFANPGQWRLIDYLSMAEKFTDNKAFWRCKYVTALKELCHANRCVQSKRWRWQVHHHLQPGRHQRKPGLAYLGD
jgi:hypothetical protein